MSAATESESKFGFKDKEKALETLKLLEEHDMQYRKLTVRGLLGRAKRVLGMTKAEEKLKNIKEAMEVFEEWLAENGGGAANKNAATNNEDKVEPVKGLGFKNKEAALTTLSVLKDRDPEYQRLAIKSLIGSSKRVLSGTKCEEKIQSIKEAVQILEEFLEKFETENMMRNNRAYLPYAIVEKFPKPENSLALEFIETYGGANAKANYKHLRTLYPKDDDSTSWDIIRNRNIAKLLEEIKEKGEKLFENDAPTSLHLELISWAYSPQPDMVKAYAEKLKSKSPEKRKHQSANSNSSDSDKESPSKKKK